MKPMFLVLWMQAQKSQNIAVMKPLNVLKSSVFAWRSGTAILADHGWKLGNETVLEELSKAANHHISISDALLNQLVLGY